MGKNRTRELNSKQTSDAADKKSLRQDAGQ